MKVKRKKIKKKKIRKEKERVAENNFDCVGKREWNGPTNNFDTVNEAQGVVDYMVAHGLVGENFDHVLNELRDFVSRSRSMDQS